MMNRESWNLSYNCTGCGDQLDSSFPELAVFIVKYSMTLLIGITNGVWICSPKTALSWGCFYKRCRTMMNESGGSTLRKHQQHQVTVETASCALHNKTTTSLSVRNESVMTSGSDVTSYCEICAQCNCVTSSASTTLSRDKTKSKYEQMMTSLDVNDALATTQFVEGESFCNCQHQPCTFSGVITDSTPLSCKVTCPVIGEGDDFL